MTIYSKFRLWLQALRVYSFTASTIPVFLGMLIARKNGIAMSLPDIFLVLIGVLAIHAAANLVNDYCDYKQGLDTKKSLGSSRVLVDKLLTEQELRIGISTVYLLALLIGCYFFWLRGLPILYFLFFGLAGSLLYSGSPAAFKYNALGEPAVFLLMGPIFFTGIYYALIGTFSTENIILSVIVGLHITAVLTANNLRDAKSDQRAGIRTLAIIWGAKRMAYVYALLLLAPYLLVVYFCLQGLLSWWSNLIWFSIPVLLPLLKISLQSRLLSPKQIVEKTVKLQFIFGLLLISGYLLNIIYQ